MDALLIFGGLLLILFGLIWLIARAFSTSLLWGCASLLPPLPLLFVVRHWRRARSAVALMGMGCIPLVVGLTMLAGHDPERLSAILEMRWLEHEPKATGGLQINLTGEYNGAPFEPGVGELIDGTLILREGDAFGYRELRMRIPAHDAGDLRLDVLPQDSGPLPEIELAWQSPDQDVPEGRRVTGGYTLHLDLQAVPPNLLRGDFHLVLPAAYRTSLSGRVELYSSDLRYIDGRVDTRHDSEATIAWVVTDYLQRSTRQPDVVLQALPPMDFEVRRLDLEGQARVAGRLRSYRLALTRSELQGWRVEGDKAPPLPASELMGATEPVPTTMVRGEARPVDRRIGFSLERLLDSPSRYQGARVQVVTERGRSAEGRFDGLSSEGRLVIQHAMGQGEASFILRPSEVAEIRLLEP